MGSSGGPLVSLRTWESGQFRRSSCKSEDLWVGGRSGGPLVSLKTLGGSPGGPLVSLRTLGGAVQEVLL